MQCELCGAEAQLEATRVAGSVLRACSTCAGSGRKATEREELGQQVWVANALEKRALRQRARDEELPERVLAADCGSRVRSARQKQGWNQAQLAQRAAEKKSVIAAIETGAREPDDKLLRRLERLLSLKLTESTAAPVMVSDKRASALTMGDLLKQELEKK